MDVCRLSAAADVVLSGRDALSVVNERHVDNFDVPGVKMDKDAQSAVEGAKPVCHPLLGIAANAPHH